MVPVAVAIVVGNDDDNHHHRRRIGTIVGGAAAATTAACGSSDSIVIIVTIITIDAKGVGGLSGPSLPCRLIPAPRLLSCKERGHRPRPTRGDPYPRAHTPALIARPWVIQLRSGVRALHSWKWTSFRSPNYVGRTNTARSHSTYSRASPPTPLSAALVPVSSSLPTPVHT